MTASDGITKSRDRSRASGLVGAVALGAGLAWATWPVLVEMVGRWSDDPRYSHGFLVPIFAGYLLWLRRDRLSAESPGRGGTATSVAGGLLLLGVGIALGLAGARYYIGWFEGLALLPALGGIALLGGGRPALRWSWPAIGFLFFMIPLPYRIEQMLGHPLQRVATLSSNYALQTMGLPAVAEGNVILLDEARIGVVEACNGLGMLMTFFAFAVGMALVLRRPLPDRALLVLSAVPIALLANVTRITVTGLLYETVGGGVADVVYHDLAGWLMMPMALAMLGLVLWLLSRLLIEVPEPAPMPLGLVPAGAEVHRGRPARGAAGSGRG